MTRALRRICIIGPECTGKTTLARQLADELSTVWVPEASRLYAEQVGRPLVATDVTPIAREHLRLADDRAAAAEARGASALVFDTDLVSTVVYSRFYYDMVPPWIGRAERRRRADRYLLCDVDVPWIADGVRDQPADREAMFNRFLRALVRRGASFTIVRGGWNTRRRTALAAASRP